MPLKRPELRIGTESDDEDELDRPGTTSGGLATRPNVADFTQTLRGRSLADLMITPAPESQDKVEATLTRLQQG